VDNPFSNDGMTTTEERLKHYSLDDERIKVLHFPPREEYVDILKSTNVFVSCARSEGWNLPLIESMACGTVSIYSNCSGQIEFAENRGLSVNILCEKPASSGNYNHFNDSIGNYYEPDFNHLSQQMRYAYENWESLKRKALTESEEIRNEFSWERVGEIGYGKVKNFMTKIKSPDYKQKDTNRIEVSYLESPKVEIIGSIEKEYFVEFLDDENNVIHSQTISTNMWTVCSRKYYTNWKVRVNGEIVSKFDLNDKRVLISLESKSIGDTIAWIPYIDEFRKKWNCQVITSTFWNKLFKKSYPDIEFVEPGTVVHNLYAMYVLGWFWNKDKEPEEPNTIPLQKAASNILGLEFKEIKPNIDFTPGIRPYNQKYVVIAPHSTAGLKYWNNSSGWQEVINYLNGYGYKVINISKDPVEYYDVENLSDVSIENTMNVIHHSEFMIGLSSGLSWLSWVVGKHVVMNHSVMRTNVEAPEKLKSF
jgi:autotransporter strand-loop-strand O-heptosyltransferase